MISKLYIENIAVIERAEIDFHKGFNVLTGETGAGKSILIDSIHAVLGQRTSRELIRTGADRAFVSATFEGISTSTAEVLSTLGVEPSQEDGGCLLLQREIRADGRGSVRINDRPATLSLLRSVGRELIHIHGQHENQALLSTERHMKYLDSMGGYADKLAAYAALYREYSDTLREWKQSRVDDAEKERRMDMLRYQIEELESASVTVGETESLKQRRERIVNAERVEQALGAVSAMIGGGEDFDGAQSMMERCCEELLSLSSLLPAAANLCERLRNLGYELEDVAAETAALREDSEFSPYELDEIETRLETLAKIRRKYGDEQEALDYLARARQELDTMERSDERLEELAQQARSLHHDTAQAAAEITSLRRAAADRFCEAVGRELTFLDMPRVTLAVDIQPCELGPNGADTVEFLISANPGEPPKPLGKIASGGELSRIMLAIKTVLADIDDIDTMIFDEVDTGISGRAAHKVGVKLREVSRSRQIICITHLAQLAAQADTHLLIQKNVEGGRTFTSVRPLDFAERREELARINGGDVITDTMRRTAEELLNNAGFYDTSP
ncbi:MAG: DNA repair protein RecN [Clostridia bacterium]|nr:DNA repair protein RecN [Clostridia bacterium]MBQ1555724.1 DNA repair protein RecN [Clostridia bacterium]